MSQGAELPEHSHPHEQVMQVIEGEFELTVDGVARRFEAGDLCAIPSDATHSGIALTDCRILDTFSVAVLLLKGDVSFI